jgi:ParB family transcriptional regulator, chromosome partitioning protein
MTKESVLPERTVVTSADKSKRNPRAKLSFDDMNLAPLSRGSDGLARLQELAEDAVNDGPSAAQAPIRWTPGMVVAVGRQYLVPLEWLEDNPNNSRVIYNDADVEELGDSLVAVGQLQAALAYAPLEPGGRFTIKEGHTRARGLRRKGLREIRIEIVERPADPFDDYRQSRELNLKRNNVTIFDDAVRFSQLVAADATRQVEISERLDVAEDYISKALKIGRLPVIFLERMARSREPVFGMSMAYLIAQFHELFGMDKADRLVSKIIEEKLSVRRVEQLVAAAKGRTRPEAKSTPRRLRPLSRSEVSGGAKGELKLFPNGRLELELSEIEESLRERLYAKVVGAFEDVGLSVSGLLPPKEK